MYVRVYVHVCVCMCVYFFGIALAKPKCLYVGKLLSLRWHT